MACSKLGVDPSVRSLISKRTGTSVFSAKVVTISTVLSVDRSSQMTTSSGVRVCAEMLSSCSSRYFSPLKVHEATDIFIIPPEAFEPLRWEFPEETVHEEN